MECTLSLSFLGALRTPEIVIKLRSAFLKLASMMDLPTIRIQQCNSNDLESVCNFYSCELIAFVRRVMEIVPKTMFQLLTHIIHLQTGQLEELPTKLPRDQMRRFVSSPAYCNSYVFVLTMSSVSLCVNCWEEASLFQIFVRSKYWHAVWCAEEACRMGEWMGKLASNSCVFVVQAGTIGGAIRSGAAHV